MATKTKYKYSKSSAFYLDTKRKFFFDNKKLLERAREQNALYASQPRRTLCKLCGTLLPQAVDLRSHGVTYTFCPDCTHLNGCFEDTNAFVERLYISDDGSDYSINYIDAKFLQRAKDIYLPKIDFLIDSLPSRRAQILDVGCGSGYFVLAAEQRGLRAAGIDVSRAMVEFGNRQISQLTSKAPLTCVGEEGFFDAIVASDATVVSALGVIEHLREPKKFFDAFRSSRAEYLFYSVPMFSFSAILESLFQSVFPRQLSGGHTHLFTEKSICRMNAIIGARSVAEWRFGTDAMDLYRTFAAVLQERDASHGLLDRWEDGFAKAIDGIQAILDKNRFCSEIHCVVAKA